MTSWKKPNYLRRNVFPIEHGDFPMSCEFSGGVGAFKGKPTLSLFHQQSAGPEEYSGQI